MRLSFVDSVADWSCCSTCLTGDLASDIFRESDHPRGQPENAGEFAPKGQASRHLKAASPDRGQWPEHIQKLRVPPAWRHVHISDDPESALQAMGMDQKGRWQAIYHARHHAQAAEAKFARIKELDQKFEAIKAQNEKNRRSKDPLTREHADVAALIMAMGIRPGSKSETGGAVQAYGATTLQGRHVIPLKKGTRLRFVGKHGVNLDLPVEDQSLAHMLAGRKAMAGNGGDLFPNVNERSLLEYMHGFDGGSFKTKDMRTLLATRSALDMVKQAEAPKNPTQYKKAVRNIAVAVSNKLGNTPTVALQSYINPTIFAAWRHSAGV